MSAINVSKTFLFAWKVHYISLKISCKNPIFRSHLFLLTWKAEFSSHSMQNDSNKILWKANVSLIKTRHLKPSYYSISEFQGWIFFTRRGNTYTTHIQNMKVQLSAYKSCTKCSTSYTYFYSPWSEQISLLDTFSFRSYCENATLKTVTFVKRNREWRFLMKLWIVVSFLLLSTVCGHSMPSESRFFIGLRSPGDVKQQAVPLWWSGAVGTTCPRAGLPQPSAAE